VYWLSVLLVVSQEVKHSKPPATRCKEQRTRLNLLLLLLLLLRASIHRGIIVHATCAVISVLDEQPHNGKLGWLVGFFLNSAATAVVGWSVVVAQARKRERALALRRARINRTAAA
jgi:hypothetical protein